MKNAAFAWIGGAMLILVLVFGLSIYATGYHKNEVERNFSRLVRQELESNYGESVAASEIKRSIEEQLKSTAFSNSKYEVTILTSDMKKGILSVRLKESFHYPGGKLGIVSITKTAIVDKEIS